MYSMRYFNGVAELKSIHAVPNEQFISLGGIKSKSNYYDSFKRLVGFTDSRELLPVERAIQYRKFASLHVCNAKCVNGKHNGTCECQCGGKNHGLGKQA